MWSNGPLCKQGILQQSITYNDSLRASAYFLQCPNPALSFQQQQLAHGRNKQYYEQIAQMSQQMQLHQG